MGLVIKEKRYCYEHIPKLQTRNKNLNPWQRRCVTSTTKIHYIIHNVFFTRSLGYICNIMKYRHLAWVNVWSPNVMLCLHECQVAIMRAYEVASMHVFQPCYISIYLSTKLFAFISGRITHKWKDKEYSVWFGGFFAISQNTFIPVSHVLKNLMKKLKISPIGKIGKFKNLAKYEK